MRCSAGCTGCAGSMRFHAATSASSLRSISSGVERAEDAHPLRERIAVERDDALRGKDAARQRLRPLHRPERIERAAGVAERGMTVARLAAEQRAVAARRRGVTRRRAVRRRARGCGLRRRRGGQRTGVEHRRASRRVERIDGVARRAHRPPVARRHLSGDDAASAAPARCARSAHATARQVATPETTGRCRANDRASGRSDMGARPSEGRCARRGAWRRSCFAAICWTRVVAALPA